MASQNQGVSLYALHDDVTPNNIELADGLDHPLTFEPEAAPEDFLDRPAGEIKSGKFIALVCPASTLSNELEAAWDINLSHAPISGVGISAESPIVSDQAGEHDFLKVQTRGRKSVKHAVLPSGTRLSIHADVCQEWASDILDKAFCTYRDIGELIARCDGNGDPDELFVNLLRTLEAAGFEVSDEITDDGVGLWDFRSEITRDELAEGILGALTRATRLPGTRRFRMDKSDETQLLEPMVRAKQDLHLKILGCESAVEVLIEIIDQLRQGATDVGSVTLKFIIPARPDHVDTADFFIAADHLKAWYANGRVMDGKGRRPALEALETLDLAPALYRRIERSVGNKGGLEDATQLAALILTFENSTRKLILEHLPYARRFAARNVEAGEDPEDVFQVSFMGLQRSIRRFDPERGFRFFVYCSFWMKQALTRWRADEGATIRIPVHRHENLAKLDGVIELLDLGADRIVSDDEVAAELDWTSDDVRRLREIPRLCDYPENADAWDELIPQLETDDALDPAETRRVVSEALMELGGRQADVIRMRFGIERNDGMTLEEIGQIYGVTRERIRQIEAKGLNFLSHPARKRHLQALLGA